MGGTYARANLRLAHDLCNNLRGDRPVEEVRPWLRRLAHERALALDRSESVSPATDANAR
jgi:hypothetical protein